MDLYIDDDQDYGVFVQRTYPNAVWVDNIPDAYSEMLRHDVKRVFLDMHIPTVNTADFARRLKATHPDVEVVLNTTCDLSDRELESISNFIDGYVRK